MLGELGSWISKKTGGARGVPFPPPEVVYTAELTQRGFFSIPCSLFPILCSLHPTSIMRSRRLLLFAAMIASAWGTQLRQIAVLDVPGRPGFDEMVFASGMLVISQPASNKLVIFDIAKRRIVQQVQGMSEPHGLAVDPRGGGLYVANAGAKNIAVISPRDWKLVRTIPVSAAPYDLAITADGSRLFAANWQDRSLSVVDLAGDNHASIIRLDGSPAALTIDADHQRLLASLQDTAEVVEVDTKSPVLLHRFKLAASQPTALVMDTAKRRLYVAARHAVLTLDPTTGQELGRAVAPAGADSMWLDAPDEVLYVASGGGTISTYRTGSRNLAALEEVQTEVRGRTVAFDPARKLVFLPGGREGRAKLLILKQLGPKETEQLATK